MLNRWCVGPLTLHQAKFSWRRDNGSPHHPYAVIHGRTTEFESWMHLSFADMHVAVTTWCIHRLWWSHHAHRVQRNLAATSSSLWSSMCYCETHFNNCTVQLLKHFSSAYLTISCSTVCILAHITMSSAPPAWVLAGVQAGWSCCLNSM